MILKSSIEHAESDRIKTYFIIKRKYRIYNWRCEIQNHMKTITKNNDKRHKVENSKIKSAHQIEMYFASKKICITNANKFVLRSK